MDFMVYTDDDFVSDFIKKSRHWEQRLSVALVMALSKVAESRGMPREHVFLLDIGGNVGVHTVYAQAAGFSVVTFEPLPQNEEIIRNNLCFNVLEQERVLLFTKRLGSKSALCQEYSMPRKTQRFI
jgi:hypothetical protein